MQPREPTLSSNREPAGPAGSTDPADTSAGPDAARARMASQLRQQGHPLSPLVQDAFATVPRHVFVPEIGPAAAYRDEALVIKCGPDGLPISSSSQPAMMAIMLDQLGLERGHRVLEIGTGSGYNAAVMSAVVGPEGEVVTIDIDPELVARASGSLRAAGADGVTVYCADGGYGDPTHAPFDRIIVTAGAWDIAPAWLDQLVAGGRLVLPLSIRGIQLSVGLERIARRCWRSTSTCRCGFVRMLGAFAGPETAIRLAEPSDIVFQVSDGNPVDVDALAAALSGEAIDEAVPVVLTNLAELAELDLWLTMTAGRLDRLTVLSAPRGTLSPAPPPPFGALVSRGTDRKLLGLAMLLPVGSGNEEPERRLWPVVPSEAAQPAGPAETAAAAQCAAAAQSPAASESGALAESSAAAEAASAAEPPAVAGQWPALSAGWTAAVRGLGPGGPELAARLVALSDSWSRLGRPGSREMEVLVWPAGEEPSRVPGQGLVLRRPSVTIAAGWPGSR